MVDEIRKSQFNKDQYEMLIRCSEKGNSNEWNEWRKSGKEDPILLEGAELGGINLQGADLSKVDLAAADLFAANLRGTKLRCANLTGANLCDADLAGTDLRKTNLVNAELWKANLKGAKLAAVIVNAGTFIWGCEFDEYTDFTGMKLDLARIDPRLKERLRTRARSIQ